METDKKTTSFTDLINSDTPVLVDFHADWCGPCKMMKPILKDLKKRVGDDAMIIKVDVDANQQAAMKYQVRSVPTLILFKNGEIKWRQAGVVQAGPLEKIINDHK
ncbi:thioredoxin [Halalkalibaculum sp. DA3122]|uniref:thioredoxin n=1 Tax=unclassified Halalkalibaculum TaxID=2964617 RepID=UPI0037543B00